MKDNNSKRLEQMDLGDHLRLKIREVPGQLLSHKLSTVTDLNRQQNCERVNRMSCSTSSRGGSAGACWRTGPTYRISCNACPDKEVIHIVDKNAELIALKYTIYF